MELQMVADGRRSVYASRRLDEFAARCRAGGLAVTPQRLAIIEALLVASSHPRAEQIFAEVRKRHPHISLATVHRTLETLCRIGEARKVTLLHDSARYDGNLAPHHHVICVRCKRIRDVEVSGLDPVLEHYASIDGFETPGWALEIQALCASCQKKMQVDGRGRARRGRSAAARVIAPNTILKQRETEK
jgi:Fur family transcriptional regulator, peroxide stress response regulator